MKTFSSKDIIIRLKTAMNIQSDNTLAKALGVTKGTLSNWKARNTIDFDLVFSKCKQINIDWLLTGTGSMLKTACDDTPAVPEPIVSYDPNVGVPYFDVDITAGFDLIFNDQTVNPTANIVVYGFEKANLWCNVTGDSMSPKICHGDMIALRECRPDDVLYGEIYAVILDNIRTVKILRKAKDPTMLRFIPINTEKYDEQEFEKSRIIRIFEVLGNISRFI